MSDEFQGSQADARVEAMIAERTAQRQAENEANAAEPQQATIKRRTDNLRAALEKAKNRDYVTLPELSRMSPDGTAVRLRCRRMTVQELAASGSLPTRADALVSELINRSMEATKGPRAEYGVEDFREKFDVDEVVQDIYGGWTREAFAAFFEFQAVVCCAAVIDDDYRFYMDYEQVRADPERGVLVWDVPQEDLDVIFGWVLQQEDTAEKSVLPFRGAAATGNTVQPAAEQRPRAERADRV